MVVVEPEGVDADVRVESQGRLSRVVGNPRPESPAPVVGEQPSGLATRPTPLTWPAERPARSAFLSIPSHLSPSTGCASDGDPCLGGFCSETIRPFLPQPPTQSSAFLSRTAGNECSEYYLSPVRSNPLIHLRVTNV